MHIRLWHKKEYKNPLDLLQKQDTSLFNPSIAKYDNKEN